jgi:hypothetical protein
MYILLSEVCCDSDRHHSIRLLKVHERAQAFIQQEMTATCMTVVSPPVVQAATEANMSQTLHVLVDASNTSIVQARECVMRLLVAPEPVYMQKQIHVTSARHTHGDWDTHDAALRQMLSELHTLGVRITVK